MEFLDSTSACELDLTLSDALDPSLAVPPEQQIFGAGEDLELSKGQVRLRVGDRPIVRRLEDFFRHSGKPVPAEFGGFPGKQIWMILFGVGILREGGFREVKRLGFGVTFPEKPRVTIIDLLPHTRFVKKVETRIKTEAALSLDGGLSVPDTLVQALAQTDVLSADATVRLSTQANVIGNLSFSVLTAAIQAIGKGGRQAEWVFEKDEQPLLGDQHMMLTLLVPKIVSELEVKVRVSAAVGVLKWCPSNLERQLSLPVRLGKAAGL